MFPHEIVAAFSHKCSRPAITLRCILFVHMDIVYIKFVHTHSQVTCETTSQATVQCLNTPGSGYSDANATFVLLCAIIVFFMVS